MAVAVPALLVAACGPNEEQSQPQLRPVRTIAVEKTLAGPEISLPGTIQAVNEVSAAFRIGGRIIERKVNVGDRVEPGAVLAVLDSQNERNALRSAQAAVTAAEGQRGQARNAFGRQESLLRSGFTTRANFEQAQQVLQSAQAQLDDARAQLKIAEDRVSFTELHADADGTVITVGAEPGEVVQAGQMVLRLARENGRDAVFDVPADLIHAMPPDPLIEIRPANAASNGTANVTQGHVREVSPQADPVTRTFQIRVGLINPPPTLLLGITVTGTIQGEALPHIIVPSSALTASNGSPAVWVVDPQALTVSLRPIEVATFGTVSATVASGLSEGDIVVTAGVQALHPDQKVRLLEVAP